MNEISWQDFEKVELRVGTVLAVEPFPEARKPAYKLAVDFGPEIGQRRSSVQITAHYTLEGLMGRQVLGVVNFPPKRIGPFMSECLICGFYREDGSVVLAVPDKPVPNGAKLGMIVSLIVAVGAHDEIGKDGVMPWHLPADLKHFKTTTLGKPVLMGRKTLAAIGRPLPERRNLVLTRDTGFSAPGCETVHSLAEALGLAAPAPELMVIGGGEVYRLTWDRADRIYLTRIQADVDGADTFFPALDPKEWKETSRADHRADARNPYDYSFQVYDRLR